MLNWEIIIDAFREVICIYHNILQKIDVTLFL